MDEQQIENMLEEELKDELEKNEADGSENSSEEKGSAFSDFLDIVESIITSIFVVLLIFTFVCRPVTVDGGSMNPTLTDKDKLLMLTFMCTPEQGDIVIVDNKYGYTYKDDSQTELIQTQGLAPAAGEDSKKIIKRVIATAGQTVDIDEEKGDVIVDGKVLEDGYVLMNPDGTKQAISAGNAFTYPLTVPEGYIFVLGDNRNNSTDSRSTFVGFVKNEDVIGEAILRFYPFGDFKLLD